MAEASGNSLEQRLKTSLQSMETAFRNADWEQLAKLEPEAKSLIEEALSQSGDGSDELTGLLNKFHTLYSETVKACEAELESIKRQLKDSQKRQETFEAWQDRNE